MPSGAPLRDLVALLAFLIITAVLYRLFGPSAGMVTGIATGLFTTYRRSNTSPPDKPPAAQAPPGEESQ